MTFKWELFLDLAKKLPQFEEAGHRSAISRAYYSVFCSARDRLIASKINIPSTSDAHQDVLNYFKLCGDYDAKKITKTLERLRVMRNNSDYDINFDGNPDEQSGKAIQRAEESIPMISAFPETLIDEIKKKSQSKF